MKTRLTLAFICLASSAHAFDADTLIAQCDAPLSQAIAAAAASDVGTVQWSTLNLVIQEHRRACSTPMAISCHVAGDPAQCYTDLIAGLDTRSENERLKLENYAAGGGMLFGALPELAAFTAPKRVADREAFCSKQSSDVSIAINDLGGDMDITCRLDAAVHQWARMSFGGAATVSDSLLLPPD